MPFPAPAQVLVNPATGELAGASGRYRKLIRDLDGLYFDRNAFATVCAARGNELAYEVYEFRPSENPGDLIFGTSILHPGKIGEEYFMTRGHIHARSDRPEIYYCQAGTGVMLMETPLGEARALPMDPQSVVYVPPYWIHRSVNIGRSVLVTLFCYPADSGQDYEIIARSQGMKVLIVDDQCGGWREMPNPRYLARSDQEIANWVPSGSNGPSTASTKRSVND